MVCAESLRSHAGALSSGALAASAGTCSGKDSGRNPEFGNTPSIAVPASSRCPERVLGSLVDPSGPVRPIAICLSLLAANAILALLAVSATSFLLQRPVGADLLCAGLSAALIVSAFVIAIASQFISHVRDGRRELIESEERIRRIAYFDALTGLPNRILFKDRVAKAMGEAARSREEFAVMFLDLDRFKPINDSLGHHVGDEVLRIVADRLSRSLRDVDTVSRLGGDEFVVLLPHTGAYGAIEVAEKLRAALTETIEVGGHALRITPSIGISVYPHDGLDLDTLVHHADGAMYLAKRQGRNGIRCHYRADARDHHGERVPGERVMRTALARREFVLHYEPRVDALSGDLVGVQARLRWQPPGRGSMPPEAFLPLAEATGLIVPLYEWGFAEACRQNLRWQKRGLAQVPVSVSFSMQQLKQRDAVIHIAESLRRFELQPDMLELELPAASLIGQGAEYLERLCWIREMGVRIVLNDFGAGELRMNELKSLPVDAVKIAASFIQTLPSNQFDAIIVRSMIDLAHGASLPVIADGVATLEQIDFLRDSGCDALQGPIVAEPHQAAAFTEWIERTSQSSRADPLSRLRVA